MAITKTDVSDPAWAVAEVAERVDGTSLVDAPIVPVSSVTGEGIDLLASKLAQLSTGLDVNGVAGCAYTRAMTPELAEYIEAGKQLTVDERLEAAHQLLLSVHDGGRDDESAEDKWVAEIERRANEILSGTVAAVDGPESHARIRAELAARRK